MMRTISHLCPALALVAFAGVALAQTPTVDGRRNEANNTNPYGSPVAVQRATVIGFDVGNPVNLCFQSNQSNVGGKAGFNVTGTQSAPLESDPTLVTTGVEVSIRLSDIMPTIPTEIRISGFINGSGHDFLSNQVFRGSTNDPENLGEPRTTDFGLELPGDQFITVNTSTRSSIAPTVDGIRNEAGYVVFSQTPVGTQFGSSSRNPPVRNRANGSEIDGVSAYIYNNGTPSNPADDFLVLHVAGNLETNFNKLELFFDYIPLQGQNTLRNDNSDVDFNGLNRMGGPVQPGGNPPPPVQPGLTFDPGFGADYWIGITCGGGTEPASPNIFVNSSYLATNGGVTGGAFGGSGANLPAAGTPVVANLTNVVAPPAGGITVDIDNSNSDAVVGSGGVGGRANLPGSGSQPDVSSPAAVTTGYEFKVNLDGIGYVPGVTEVKVAGIITGQNYDYMSNQAIGGLTQASALDPNNLGFQARDVNLKDWDGNQYVTVPVPGVIPNAPAGVVINGSVDAGETAFYGSPLWVNLTNATGFGDSVGSVSFTPGLHRSAGSEMDSVYFRVARDPSNGNKPTLYGVVTGNLHDFNKLVLFFDTNPAAGQEDIRADNAGFENFNNGLGGTDGFEFDAGFTADYAIAYTLGYDTTADVARHFCDGTQLLTNGGGYGGRFGGGNKTTVVPVCGTIQGGEGFRSNNLPPLASPLISVNSNGSELDAVYLRVVPSGQAGTLYMFFAGNLRPNLTNLELFFDVTGGGQNTLIYDARDPADPLYAGNPGTDFQALNRMGGPFQPAGDPAPPVQPGFTFDAGFEADYWFSYRGTNFQASVENGDSISLVANYARLRTLGQTGPLPDEYDRFIGSVLNDVFASQGSSFINGEISESISAGFINNANILGVPEGRQSFCPGASGTFSDPATVLTGLEVAINLEDLGFGPGRPFVVGGPTPTQIKFTAFLNGPGHSNVSNQFAGTACVGDLGEPRLVNLANIPGNQYVQWPTAVPHNGACTQPTFSGDANGDGIVNFDDITAVLGNFGNSYGIGLTGPGDANGSGSVNFDDITTVLGNFGSMQVGGCNG